jgi:DNA-binding transcriptional LysR family regulator
LQWDDRIGKRLKLRDVHMLLAAVQCGSMAKAAERLSVSHPVVSKTIADLEHTLGVRLLERSRQGVEPTLYGRAVLKHGLAAFDELRQCVKEIELLADPTAGEVRIGSLIPLAASFTTAVVDQVSQRYPRIAFQLISGTVDTLYRELSDRNLDLLLTWKLATADERLFGFEPLYEDPFVVVAGAQSPWAQRRKIELAELVNEPWVLPPPDISIGAMLAEAFRAKALNYPAKTVAATPHDVRISFLATGRFLTIFHASVLKFSTRHPGLKILPVELPIPRVTNGIVTLKNRILSPVAQLFIDHARAVAKPLAKGPWRPVNTG